VSTTNPYGIKMVATDLDGTLLRDDKSISKEDQETLNLLGNLNIIKVVATGRSMYKVLEALELNLPFDYIVFSSGSGIYDWKKQTILLNRQFSSDVSCCLLNFLLDERINFMVFEPIPNNNRFSYHCGGEYCPEFSQYIERHAKDGSLLDKNFLPVDAGQFICILPNDEMIFDSMRSKILSRCEPLKIIRTTSPVDDRYIWMEVFPESVSKGHGLEWICRETNIGPTQVVALGNDFNDLDMLEYSGHPWVVSNACKELKTRFDVLGSGNNDNSLSELCRKYKLV